MHPEWWFCSKSLVMMFLKVWIDLTGKGRGIHTVEKPCVENLTHNHCQNLFLGFGTKLRQVLFLQVTVLCLLIIDRESYLVKRFLPYNCLPGSSLWWLFGVFLDCYLCLFYHHFLSKEGDEGKLEKKTSWLYREICRDT